MKMKDRESIRFFSPPEMRYIRVVSGTNVTNDFARHVHHSYCIGTVYKGARLVSCAGRSVVVPEGAMFVINPETAHTCRSQGGQGHNYLAICVDREKMKDIASQVFERPKAFPYIKDVALFDNELVSKLKEFVFLLGSTDSIMATESVLISLLSELLIRNADSPLPLRCLESQKGTINRVCEFIT